MKKILLTSTGFDNENIMNKFIELLNVDVKNAKVLFIITAANDPDAVRILSGCLDDLTKCGIQDNNITVYDMHKLISQEEITKYDAIYVCGGSTKYLVDRISELNIKPVIDKYIEQGGIYIGVSAGSICTSGKYKNGLGFIKNILDVHCDNGSNNGIINSTNNIYLTNNQAIFIDDNGITIFE
ncbi:MAG: Type 1 glutamine amidotransferase-like domain-containing protein [Bacilli bacterium]|nr:Type 1 glutamine amidotransferase-like domain-containing protein [Bacilli bacterium]